MLPAHASVTTPDPAPRRTPSSSRPSPPRSSSCRPSWVTPAPAALLAAYHEYLRRRGGRPPAYWSAVRAFFARWPDPACWAREPLAVRLSANDSTRPLITFLMLHGLLHPGYDYLLERKLVGLWQDLATSPFEADMTRFLATADRLGFSARVGAAAGSQVPARLLIQTGRRLDQLRINDLEDFEQACRDRQDRTGAGWRHYQVALLDTHRVLFHLGILPDPPLPTVGPVPFAERLQDVREPIRASLVAYLERKQATCVTKTVSSLASRLTDFGRFLTAVDPRLTSLAGLDRRRHIEPYLTWLTHAPNSKHDGEISVAERARRVLAVTNLLADITAWGWPEAPDRQVVFRDDVPRLPRLLPRYLPHDVDRRLQEALTEHPENVLAARALQLQRACGLRIGELLDLELDCVHEVPDNGAWLKVPLGKLDRERMIPLDPETVTLIDQITAIRSPGRALPHPRYHRPAQFLFTHHGRRLSSSAVRDELDHAAATAGLDHLKSHQLRHTWQGPGVVVMCPVRGGSWSDLEDVEGVVAVVEVAAGVGDVGSSGESEGADCKVAEGCEGARRGSGAQLGSVLVPGAVPYPMQTIFHNPVASFVVVQVDRAGQVGRQAGDPVDDLLVLHDAVQSAGVAAQPEGLGRTGKQGVVGGRDADGASFHPPVPAVVLAGGGLGPIGVRAGQQRLRGGMGDRLVAFNDQNVVAVQVLGDQPGGDLLGVQGVQGPHHPRYVQTGQQVPGGDTLTALGRNLTLAQDRAAGVADRTDQEHRPGLGARPPQRLPVQGRAGQHPFGDRVFGGPLDRAALLPLDRARGVRHDRGRCHSPLDVTDPAADHCIQGVGVQPGQHPPERPLTGHHEPARERIPPRAQTRQLVLRSPSGPLPDRRHRVRADHQRRAGGQPQDQHQPMAQSPLATQIRNLRQPRHQRGLHLDGVGGQFGLPPGPVGQLVKNRLRRAGCRHERGSPDGLQASTTRRSPGAALPRQHATPHPPKRGHLTSERNNAGALEVTLRVTALRNHRQAPLVRETHSHSREESRGWVRRGYSE
jgi:integrase